MEDMENLASKKPVRAVSSRHLYRNAADLLDEIEDEGHSILIVRYGRPTAILTPVPGYEPGTRIRPKRRGGDDDRVARLIDPNQEEEPLPDIELDPAQKHVLLHFEDRSYDDGTLTGSQMITAKARLEMARVLT